MHCFTGSTEFAKKLLDLNSFFSASGIITFKNSIALQETFKTIPEFIKKDPLLLKAFIKATRLLGKEGLYLKTLADMVVRYPLGDHSNVLKELSPFQMNKLRGYHLLKKFGMKSNRIDHS